GGIRAGHLYTAVDALAAPPSFEFTATDGTGTLREGDETSAGKPLILHVRSNAPSAFTTTVWNGATVFSGNHHEADFAISAPAASGAFWVEIRSDRGPNPLAWLRSNPIYVGAAARVEPVAGAPPAAKAVHAIAGTAAEPAWRVEHDPLSAAAVDAVSGAPG